MSDGIWSTDERIPDRTHGDYVVFHSDRCGGPYRLTGSVLPQIQNATEQERLLLTEAIWRLRQQESDAEVIVNTDFFYGARELSVPSLVERFNRGLDLLTRTFPNWGKYVAIAPDEREYLLFLGTTYSRTHDEIRAFFDEYERRGYVDHVSEVMDGQIDFKLSFDAYARRTDGSLAVNEKVFVAMWFHQSMNDAYLQGIDPAVRDCGYLPERIDNVEHNNKIDDEIISRIRMSGFVIADFTSERDKPRGGVYYEAGFAQGLGLPVIWMCRSDLIDSIHFDTRQYNHIVWDNPDDLRQKLSSRIIATLGTGPLKEGD
ncbi:hypothetical protein [Hyphomonas adhaerens]|uniref:hypothetical protein n=1 Tax=Hyphomonas adhaerens TaxID=81029 RepID=UPI002352B3F1|nr:hypothetical protein [Hyphomonas adhaerens]